MRPGVLSFFFSLAHTLSLTLASVPLASRERRASAGRLSKKKESDMILPALSNKPALGSIRSVGKVLCY